MVAVWSPSLSGHYDASLKTKKWNVCFLYLASYPSFFLFNVYLFLRVWAGEGQREREREGDRGSESGSDSGPQTHELWDHDLSRRQHLTDWATQAPYIPIFIPLQVFLLLQNAPFDICPPCFLIFCLQTTVFFFPLNWLQVFNRLHSSVKDPLPSSFNTNCWKECEWMNVF